MTLALADANTGRLLRILSLGGPTSAETLMKQLALPPEEVRDLLRDASALGVVRGDKDDLFWVEPVVVAELVHQNRTLLLGHSAYDRRS